jgi:hypothetical protein
MSTFDLLTDNPANYPTQVRAPDGSSQRNATTEVGGFQDLADRTANLNARLTNSLPVRGFYVGLRKSISDNTHIGPSPQTVANTPRQVYDLDGSALVLAGPTVTAGDRLLINISPINLVSVDTVLSLTYVRVQIGSKTYNQVFESIANTAGTAVPFVFQMSVLHTAVASGAISMSLWAWSATLSNVTIYSPCNASNGSPAIDPTLHYDWPNDGTTGTQNQQWASIVHFGAGI